jgi:cyclophilin family peptidyl-prolyl cis-trans isomerase
MTPSDRQGRRIPPKSRSLRATTPPAGGPVDPDDPFAEIDAAAGEAGEAGGASGAGRGPTRAQNRAAKRASGVRPKAVARGRVTGRANRSTNTGLIALAVGAFIVGIGVLALANPFGGPSPSASPSSAPASQGPVGDGTCPTTQPPPLAPGDVRNVTVETEKGTIVLKIDGTLAPIATGNFIALVECEFYDGIGFHRLMPGFVIQGGDPAGDGSGGPGYEIKDDPVTAVYKRGTVAMARTPFPDSQGSQFFIVLADNANQSLQSAQYKYAILGEVTSGMDVVDAIAAMPNSGGNEGTALDPVIMTRVTVAPPATPTASPAAPTAVPASPAAPTAAPSAAPTTSP